MQYMNFWRLGLIQMKRPWQWLLILCSEGLLLWGWKCKWWLSHLTPQLCQRSASMCEAKSCMHLIYPMIMGVELKIINWLEIWMNNLFYILISNHILQVRPQPNLVYHYRGDPEPIFLREGGVTSTLRGQRLAQFITSSANMVHKLQKQVSQEKQAMLDFILSCES